MTPTSDLVIGPASDTIDFLIEDEIAKMEQNGFPPK